MILKIVISLIAKLYWMNLIDGNYLLRFEIRGLKAFLFIFEYIGEHPDCQIFLFIYIKYSIFLISMIFKWEYLYSSI